VAAAAARARLLSRTGAIAAATVGAAAVAAGWRWGIVLVVFFVLTSALSLYGVERKRALTRGVLAKGAQRDAIQVLSNGGAFAAAGIGWLLTGSPVLLAAGAGAIAAAAADSWATEIGIAFGGTPRSVISWTPMTRGASGAVTVAGFAGALAGAVAMAATMLLIGWPRAVAGAAFLAGMPGMVVDSVLGATVQARRFCLDCRAETEQPVHHCGRPTQVIRGARWMDNDIVNLVATLSGAVIAAILFVVAA
jgi:uncharacterized protein (TIGR00297 family)